MPASSAANRAAASIATATDVRPPPAGRRKRRRSRSPNTRQLHGGASARRSARFAAPAPMLAARLRDAGVAVTHRGPWMAGAAATSAGLPLQRRRRLPDRRPQRHPARLRQQPSRHGAVRPGARLRRATRIALARADQCSAGRLARRGRPVPGGRLHGHAPGRRARHGRDAHRRHAGQRGGGRRQPGRVQRRAVDIAMQKGVNYPRGRWPGPMRSASRTSSPCCSNLAQAYGEDRYRVSPLLRRKLAANPGGARFHA
jgi:3-hydroxybutyryl-CoA dehydrogenase